MTTDKADIAASRLQLDPLFGNSEIRDGNFACSESLSTPASMIPMEPDNATTHEEYVDNTNTSNTDATTDTNVNDEEARLFEAVHALRSGVSSNIKQTAKEFSLSYDKLRRRYHGESKPRGVAYAHLQLLTPTQEEVICDWAIFLSLCGEAITKETLGLKIRELIDATKVPSSAWWRLFLKRHPDRIRLGRPSGIPPKRAQAFNFEAVNGLFTKIDKVLKEYDIPWELVFNMDKNGLQVGSRKVDRKKCLIPTATPNMVKLQSDSLQLITVIECVSAKGVALDPAFVFPGESHFDSWYNIEGFEESRHL